MGEFGTPVRDVTQSPGKYIMSLTMEHKEQENEDVLRRFKVLLNATNPGVV